MPTVQTFIRRTPVASLKAYFEYVGIDLSAHVDWDEAETEINRNVIKAIGELDKASHNRIVRDSQRVGDMADEAGRVAIYSVAKDREHLRNLENDHARVLWLLINDRNLLLRAEEVRHTDENRRGRSWDGYVCDKKLTLDKSEGAISELKEAIKHHFSSTNVHIDIFDRIRKIFDGKDCEIIQLTVYRDGDLEDMLSFNEGGDLINQSYRPVFEAAMTYEPSVGVIEVVSRNRETRKAMAELFAVKLLKTDFESRKIDMRRYDLNVLLRPHQFPFDLEDDISSVEVRQLRLMPIGSKGERITLECLAKADRTIWDLADDKLGHDELARGWTVTQAKIVIKFHPKDGASRGRTLPLTITMPHGCNLKERTDDEQLIGEKYLCRWGILADDQILIED